MSTWYKEGVFGELTAGAAEGLRLVEKLVGPREEIFITSIREGTHCYGTLHHSGNAWDMRKLKCLVKSDLATRLGQGYDVVDEDDHWHIEYQPHRQV